MRIIAGRLKGRRLQGGVEAGVRPTSDRLRETLFNVIGPRVVSARVLDAFAGTGALGIEAISRGAAHVTFIERDRRVISQLEHNISTCDITDACAIIRVDFSALRMQSPSTSSPGPFDLVLIDPPYDVDDLESVVTTAARWLAPDALLVLEHRRGRETPIAVAGARRTRVLNDGDSALSFYRQHHAERGETSTSMSHPMRTAVVPGSFDPLTNGHVDLVERSLALFDRVVVAVLINAEKRPAFFSTEERVSMIRDVFSGRAGLEVEAFDGLLVDLAARHGAVALVRGLRSATDFDYELPMALMNRHLRPTVDTVYLPASGQVSYISSRLVREVASLGGSIEGLVPEVVAARLARRQSSIRTQQV